ncbi:MAG: ABC transporter permease [Candidatus Zixiibacteriota bacterium]|nr:MAG: ABC transporter permease [candidate division Zixibacteria bacterium]
MDKIRFIAAKEIRHILRDSRSLIIAILMPVVMTLLYGYAVNLDIKNITLGVLDFDRSLESRELIGDFCNSGYFTEASGAPRLSDPEQMLKSGTANVVLIIRPGLSEAISNIVTNPDAFSGRGEIYQLGMLVDGSDANVAAAASAYASIIVNQFLAGKLPPEVELPGVTISHQALYNPDLQSSHFFVPGLIAIILMMISALLTSITITREKETGTMEQLLTSPVSPRQIIIGKILPYIALALLDGILILLFGVLHFGVPLNGSMLLLFFFMSIYIFAALSIGVLISTLVDTQQLAMMSAMMVTVLPSVMLSGFIFEIKNMPAILQAITHIVPARYFLVIIRGIMLKGAGIAELWMQAVALCIITVLLLGIASKRFKFKIG